jgi:hypothetical protein
MKINFCINSTINRFDETKNIIIPTLLQNNICPNNIYYFLSGDNKISHYIDPDYNINVITLNYNSMDFNSFIGITDLNIQSDFWFYLHDTCYVADYFYKKILSIEKIHEYDAIRATNNGTSMNYGLYKYNYLLKIKKSLLNYKNFDYSEEALQKQKLKAVSFENALLYPNALKCFVDCCGNDHENIEYEKLKYFYFSDKSIIHNYNNLGPQNIFKKGNMRLLFFYEDIGIFKIGANYFDTAKTKKWILDL